MGNMHNFPGNHGICESTKVRCMKDGKKIFDGRCGAMWRRCHGDQSPVLAAERAVDSLGPICVLAKSACLTGEEKRFDESCLHVWRECNAEAKRLRSVRVGTKIACYLDQPCLAKVDWPEVERVKAAVFADLIPSKTRSDSHNILRKLAEVKKEIVAAKLPAESVESMLASWFSIVYRDAFAVDESMQGGA